MEYLYRNRRWFDAVWLLLIAFYCLGRIELVPLHGDEPTQISMGRDFYYQFVQGDWSKVRYTPWDELSPEAAAEQDLRLLNGTLPKYLFGLTAYTGGYAVDEINEQWVWGAGWDWNHTNGHVPDEPLLMQTRVVSTTLLIVSAWALFGIGYLIQGQLVAVLASAMYILNPAVLLNGRRAMMEGSMLAFSLLALLAGLWLLRKQSWQRVMLLGIASGLAVASKHTAVFTIAAVFAGIGLFWLWEAVRQQKWRERMPRLAKLCSAGIMALLVFFALNPAWWGDPIGRAQEVLERRSELLAGQTATFGGYEDFPAKISGFWRQVFVVELMVAETEIDGFLSNQQERIAQYQVSITSGYSPGVMGGIALLMLVIIGIGAMLRGFMAQGDAWLLGIWAIAMLALTLLLTTLEWQRYYLPAYPVVSIFAALGIAQILQFIRRTT